MLWTRPVGGRVLFCPSWATRASLTSCRETCRCALRCRSSPESPAAGIVDPAAVARSALQYAASIAAMLFRASQPWRCLLDLGFKRLDPALNGLRAARTVAPAEFEASAPKPLTLLS